MESRLSNEHQQKLLKELKELENQSFEIDGKIVRPSQCYHWEADPAHLLYNTNCPPILKQKLDLIIAKYVPKHEGSAS
jgi:hypothetical protein